MSYYYGKRTLLNWFQTISVDYNSIFRPKNICALQIHTSLNRNVGLLRLFPSITLEAVLLSPPSPHFIKRQWLHEIIYQLKVRVFLQPPTLGVVLQTYGSGNIPTNRKDLLEEIDKASRQGILIINCTQCGHGSVAAIYETGQICGVIPGFDMTPGRITKQLSLDPETLSPLNVSFAFLLVEAALTKLSYVLGRSDWSLEVKREMLQSNLKGELTKCSSKRPYNPVSSSWDNWIDTPSPKDNLLISEGSDLVQQVIRMIATSLGMALPEEIEEIQRILGGSLTCAFLAQVTDSNYSEKNLKAIFGDTVSL